MRPYLNGSEKRAVSYGPVSGDLRYRAGGLSSGSHAVEMAADYGRWNSAPGRRTFTVSPRGRSGGAIRGGDPGGRP